MLLRFLLFIKHRVPLVWLVVERVNSFAIQIYSQYEGWKALGTMSMRFQAWWFQFRRLCAEDLLSLFKLINDREKIGLHSFNRTVLIPGLYKRSIATKAFLMFGVFQQQEIVGYFFLRCFWNRKCFVGRLIDEPCEKKGIGRVMNPIMYHTAWRSGFRCFTTVSQSNDLVMRSHKNNPFAKVLKKLRTITC